MKMEQYHQFVLVFILAGMIESNGATIDIELKINMENHRKNNGHKMLGHANRQHEKPEPKRHFLKFDSDDFIEDSSEIEYPSKPNISTRSASEQIEDQDPDYPYEEIKVYLKANPHLQKYFNPAVPVIGNRGSETDEEGESLCNSLKEAYYSPQKLPNIKGEMKTIINDQENQQYIERERCASDLSGRCSSIKILGYSSTCVQHYSNRRLMIFDKNLTKTHQFPFNEFSIPSCCVCKLKLDRT